MKKEILVKKTICIVSLIMCALFLIMSEYRKKRDEVVYTEKQWALFNEGQEVCGIKGCEDVDIGQPKSGAVQLDENGRNIICIVDSGINFDISQLNGTCIYKSEEKPKRMDHGTRIAGLISVNNKNGYYKSVLSGVKFISVVIDDKDIIDENKLILELSEAEKMGARVVNCSFVYNYYSKTIYDYIKNSKMLFVCSSGNGHTKNIMYPAAYDLPNVISVMGINSLGQCSRESNYSDKIDVAAPCDNILVMNDEEELEYVTGVSYSTAFVTAVAAYIINKKDYDSIKTKSTLLNNCNERYELDKYVKRGRTLSFENVIKDIG